MYLQHLFSLRHKFMIYVFVSVFVNAGLCRGVVISEASQPVPRKTMSAVFTTPRPSPFPCLRPRPDPASVLRSSNDSIDLLRRLYENSGAASGVYWRLERPEATTDTGIDTSTPTPTPTPTRHTDTGAPTHHQKTPTHRERHNTYPPIPTHRHTDIDTDT